MNDAKVYAPFRCVAAFADGSRLLFDGLTREQARSTMNAAMEQHGDIGWWNWVTDENYRNGEYYKLIPPPPHFAYRRRKNGRNRSAVRIVYALRTSTACVLPSSSLTDLIR